MKNHFILFALGVFFLINTNTGEAVMQLTSPAFNPNQMIPAKYTCRGADINPALMISGVPENTISLALIVDDPDAPMGTWVHWVVYNIPPQTAAIPEDSVPGSEAANDFGRVSYGGPCPPSGTHRYFFKLYALDTIWPGQTIRDKKELERKMSGHILAQAELIGRYSK